MTEKEELPLFEMHKSYYERLDGKIEQLPGVGGHYPVVQKAGTDLALPYILIRGFEANEDHTKGGAGYDVAGTVEFHSDYLGFKEADNAVRQIARRLKLPHDHAAAQPDPARVGDTFVLGENGELGALQHHAFLRLSIEDRSDEARNRIIGIVRQGLRYWGPED